MKKITAIIISFVVIFSVIAINRNTIDEEDNDSELITEKEDNDSDEEVTDDYVEKSKSEIEEDGNTVVQNDEPSCNSLPNGIEIPLSLTKRDEQIIKHTGFTVSYNKSHNTPNWSAWNLTADHASGNIPRGKKFWADETVPSAYRVEYYEYKGSGYDRGHMCPAGDNKWSREAMHDCFYMTNMCPQDPILNGESWKDLEEACREWVMAERSLYIVCGPVYRGNSHERIGMEHSIDVPEAFFKAVLSLRPGNEKSIAFLYENNNRRQSMSSTAMSVDEVEEIIGMDLFYQLDDDLEKRLESTYSLRNWR